MKPRLAGVKRGDTLLLVYDNGRREVGRGADLVVSAGPKWIRTEVTVSTEALEAAAKALTVAEDA